MLVAFDLGDELFYCHWRCGEERHYLTLEICAIALLSALAFDAVVTDATRLGLGVAEVLLDNATATLILLVGVVEQVVETL